MCGLTKFCRLAVKSCGWGDIVNGIGVVCVEERVQRTEKRCEMKLVVCREEREMKSPLLVTLYATSCAFF